ncbi:MAG: hypothetical protein ACUVQ0_01985 [Thermoproteota archaeon]
MEASRMLYLAGGIVFLAVTMVGGAWWELLGGEQFNPVLYIGFSPFYLNAELFGLRIFDPPPVVEALLLAERLLAALYSARIIVGVVAYSKPWSRKLVGLNPLTYFLGFAILLIVGIVALPGLIPMVKEFFPNLSEALIPYSGKQLAINLYHVMNMNGNIYLPVYSCFTLQFWAAACSGIFCLAAALMRRREIRLGKTVHREGLFETG